MGAPSGQRSFEDLGEPLREVTFCVLDLETTGGSPQTCAITEVGAVKVRGGEWLGTFHTLVNPGCTIPPEITVLTGITEVMVVQAPRIEAVLPSLEEFVRGTVIVGHNIRFDLSFLNAALLRTGRHRLANRSVDTCALARRLVRDEVPNLRLGTLATRFRLDHQPSHRALDDALATTDLLHVLLERAAAWGVTGLDDLLALPKIDAHPQASKLKLTTALPRTPGVYLFRDARGEVLYVGKATNLRQRVRSYFSGDERRKVGPLLRETSRIEHVECESGLEASVTEVRLIHRHQPRYNRQVKLWRRYAYVRLTLREAFPRLAVVKTARADGSLHIGPLPSAAAARMVADAIESVVPLRRCTSDPKRNRREGPCAPAQLGVASCPCAGTIDAGTYRQFVDRTVRGLTAEPEVLLAPLRERMFELARAQRFEEAADVRDRGEALASALRRQFRIDTLRGHELLYVQRPKGHPVVLRRGLLHDRPIPEGDGDAPSADGVGLLPVRAVASSPVTAVPSPAPSLFDALPDAPGELPPANGPLPRELVDELLCVATWLDRTAPETLPSGPVFAVPASAAVDQASGRSTATPV